MMSGRKSVRVTLGVLVLLCSVAVMTGCASKRPGVVAGGTVAGASSGGKATLVFGW